MKIECLLAVIGLFPNVLSDPKNAKPVDVPYFAAIKDTESNEVMCGGAIISKYHVLTTCNCTGWYTGDVVNTRFQKIAFDMYEILVGLEELNQTQTTGKVYKIKDVYYFDKCKFDRPSGFTHNIGAIEVTKPFKCTEEIKFAPPVPPFSNVESYIIDDLVNLGRTCYVAGFAGYSIMALNRRFPRLTRQMIELMGFQKCQLYEPWWLSESEKLTGVDIANGKHICAKSYDFVENSQCVLEQGDPVVCDGHLIGLVSFIDLNACRENSIKFGRPLVIARIDVAYEFYRAMAGMSRNSPTFYFILFLLFFVEKSISILLHKT